MPPDALGQHLVIRRAHALELELERGHQLQDLMPLHLTNVPNNITLLPVPPRSPQLNPVENVWAYLRNAYLANRAFPTIDDLMEACCKAWNALTDEPGRIRSSGSRTWALMAQNF
jgi:hypothetical protein